MQTWLITGGAGFIGANFARAALKGSTARLVILDALTYAGNLASIDDVLASGRVEFVKGDISDRALVTRLLIERKVDHVAHFAAESHVDRSILGPRAFLETNVLGTFEMLEATREAQRQSQREIRFLHVSTDEVFGSLDAGEPPANERTKYAPNSPYSASKAASDHFARAWRETYGLSVVITNCSNNYGPWQFPEKLIPLMIVNALEGKTLPVYGDGLQVRDWIHVEDHCAGLLLALQKGRPGETYNIGGSDERPNRDIVALICRSVDERDGRAAGTTERQVEHVVDRPGHDRRYAIDSSKIERELGWKPVRRLESALPELVNWYVERKAWVDSIRSGAYRDYYAKQYSERV